MIMERHALKTSAVQSIHRSGRLQYTIDVDVIW